MRQYKVGDIVQIRQWDDMVREFGVSEYGSIQCHCSFVKEMKKYCGKRLQIVDIDLSVANHYYLNGAPSWTFTLDMFEKGALSTLIARRRECIK